MDHHKAAKLSTSLGPRRILQDDSIPIDIFERFALQVPIRVV